MRLLSFDTSAPSLSVALIEDGVSVCCRTVPPSEGGRQEAVSRLMPTIDAIIKERGWEKGDLDGVVVGTGPGSFTGVRVSVTTARAICQGLDLPLVGVSRFASIASLVQLPAGIILDGGRGHLFVAAYDRSGEIVAPACIKTDELDAFAEKTGGLVTGYVSEVELNNFAAKSLPDLSEIASVQGIIGSEALTGSNDRKKQFPYNDVKPLYLRGASITLKKKKDATGPDSNLSQTAQAP
ncbi:MAG: tRNA (adenosine(37)-N6)-threonylcarbamoyltransferase complex dimerization subunit type 1 TsaB [Cyanobacteria bacterium HKST-UBA02]|nr:tRNA (adenosine(37)-N6)-threonylcarbamoyltransferase complex dimerization subunit type 1 TsaB [Cyanobacteria bacterium HKST-UBA02]